MFSKLHYHAVVRLFSYNLTLFNEIIMIYTQEYENDEKGMKVGNVFS